MSRTPRPWLTTTCVDQKLYLWSHPLVFRSVSPYDDALPSVFSFIGRQTKSSYVAGLLGFSQPFEPHGEVRLATRPCKPTKLQDVFIDCEISLQSNLDSQHSLARCLRQSLDWLDIHRRSVAETQLQDRFIADVLTPLSSVVCYFAADLGGLKGIAHLLARQAVLPSSHNLPSVVLPRVLIVTTTVSKLYDTLDAQVKLREHIIREMMVLDQNISVTASENALDRKFRGIYVMGMQKNLSYRRRLELLNQRLVDLVQDSHWSRRMNRYLFSVKHVEAFAGRIIQAFCANKGSFNFIKESRCQYFDTSQVEEHLGEVLALIPDATWLWRIVIPLAASAYCLASYPSGSHYFSSNTVFDEYFRDPAGRAISAYTTDTQMQSKFIRNLNEKMEVILRDLEFDPASMDVLAQHKNYLTCLWPHLANLKTFKTCLYCLMFMPEKVLHCGHAICDVCVRRCGKASKAQRHSFVIENCPLCGHFQPITMHVFRLIPPTAGIRALCLDGGGVRGVVPLIMLKHLQIELDHLGCPIHELFDYVCGTSAGGLIALGVFLMRWSPTNCLERFEQLAATTFKGKEEEKPASFSQKLHRVFHAWVNDHRYNLSPIERAFRSDSFAKMFNPLQSDTKVAVMATSVRGNVPCVIANYNGGPRSTDINYSHIRAASCHHDMTISDAAACTSAAPFFFKSKDMPQLDTFQDGGLKYNCPALPASWECAVLWPDRCQMYDSDSSRLDHMISLGTGTTLASKHKIGPHSPKQDRFLTRLVDSFMDQLDAEEQWRTFFQSVPSELRSRFQRLNIYLSTSQPALDDTEAIENLKEEASKSVNKNNQLHIARDSMVASLFYYELDEVSRLEGGAYQCCGTIFCRLPVENSSHHRLHQWLLEKHAFFTIRGQTIPCAISHPIGSPIFRCSVTIIVANMEERLSISVTGVTSESTVISGMPVSVRSLLQAQSLDSPFGCIDNRQAERRLPPRPSKRQARDL